MLREMEWDRMGGLNISVFTPLLHKWRVCFCFDSLLSTPNSMQSFVPLKIIDTFPVKKKKKHNKCMLCYTYKCLTLSNPKVSI